MSQPRVGLGLRPKAGEVTLPRSSKIDTFFFKEQSTPLPSETELFLIPLRDGSSKTRQPFSSLLAVLEEGSRFFSGLLGFIHLFFAIQTRAVE
jgi:hypothetical protein